MPSSFIIRFCKSPSTFREIICTANKLSEGKKTPIVPPPMQRCDIQQGVKLSPAACVTASSSQTPRNTPARASCCLWASRLGTNPVKKHDTRYCQLLCARYKEPRGVFQFHFLAIGAILSEPRAADGHFRAGFWAFLCFSPRQGAAEGHAAQPSHADLGCSGRAVLPGRPRSSTHSREHLLGSHRPPHHACEPKTERLNATNRTDRAEIARNGASRRG